ncbi:MAG: hypothetical protein ACLTDV_06050 [Eubacterium sp.]
MMPLAAKRLADCPRAPDFQNYFMREKRIYVNGRQYDRNSGILKSGDIVSVRGFGKFVFRGFLQETTKGRIRVGIAEICAAGIVGSATHLEQSDVPAQDLERFDTLKIISCRKSKRKQGCKYFMNREEKQKLKAEKKQQKAKEKQARKEVPVCL